MPFVLSCIVGVVLGAAYKPGRTVALSDRLDGSTLLLLLFVVQALFRSAGARLGLGHSHVVALWALSSLALVLVASLNADMPGLKWMALGIGLNLLVTVACGGMPAIGRFAESLPILYSRSDSPLALLLGDTIHVPLPIAGSYLVSAGDICILVGTVLFVAGLTRGVVKGIVVREVANERNA